GLTEVSAGYDDGGIEALPAMVNTRIQKDILDTHMVSYEVDGRGGNAGEFGLGLPNALIGGGIGTGRSNAADKSTGGSVVTLDGRDGGGGGGARFPLDDDDDELGSDFKSDDEDDERRCEESKAGEFVVVFDVARGRGLRGGLTSNWSP
ncbi:hypothetical protein H0H93_002094, partial [Arthromyces matolae]